MARTNPARVGPEGEEPRAAREDLGKLDRKEGGADAKGDTSREAEGVPKRVDAKRGEDEWVCDVEGGEARDGDEEVVAGPIACEEADDLPGGAKIESRDLTQFSSRLLKVEFEPTRARGRESAPNGGESREAPELDEVADGC